MPEKDRICNKSMSKASIELVCYLLCIPEHEESPAASIARRRSNSSGTATESSASSELQSRRRSASSLESIVDLALPGILPQAFMQCSRATAWLGGIEAKAGIPHVCMHKH